MQIIFMKEFFANNLHQHYDYMEDRSITTSMRGSHYDDAVKDKTIAKIREVEPENTGNTNNIISFERPEFVCTGSPSPDSTEITTNINITYYIFTPKEQPKEQPSE